MKITIDCADEQELAYVQQAMANAAEGEIGAGVVIADGHGQNMLADEVIVTVLGRPLTGQKQIDLSMNCPHPGCNYHGLPTSVGSHYVRTHT